jgi:hypothetical protein
VKISYCAFLIIFFLLLIPSQSGISQSKSGIGLELGIAFSQFRTKNVVSQYGETTTTTINPVISPLIAVSKGWPLTKHLQIITGLQYQMSGKRSYSYTDYTATTSYMEEWETLKMHKLCLPLTLGYFFKSGNFQPFLYLGIRPNIILLGNIYSRFHEIVVLSAENENTIDYNDKRNIFEKNEYFVPPKRIFNQVSAGVSFSIKQHININFSYNYGHNYYKSIFVNRGNHSTYSWSEKTSIPACDYIISVKYVLNVKKVSM